MQCAKPDHRRRILIGLALLLSASLLLPDSLEARPRARKPWRGYYSAQLSKPMSRTRSRTRLINVRGEVRRQVRKGKRPTVVFDIDHTLVYHTPKNKTRAINHARYYVSSLAKAGANIVYLTARKEKARTETTAMLKRKGFPLASASHLLMNDTKLKGDLWKRAAKPRVLAHGKPLALYDNDFTHVRNYRQLYPQALVFRINTISNRRDPGGAGTIEVLSSYFKKRKR